MFDLNHLPNSLPDEKPVYFLRRHPITLTGLFLGYALLIAMPLAGFAALKVLRPALLDQPMFAALLTLGVSAFFLFAWLFLFQSFTDYYLNMWIVTTHRILSIEQRGLFSRTVSELRLSRVQDATASISGFLHTMLNYGDVEIQTAGEKERFLFEDVRHPAEIEKKILELSETDRRGELDQAVEEFGALPRPPATAKME